jgi:hypothetical protein
MRSLAEGFDSMGTHKMNGWLRRWRKSWNSLCIRGLEWELRQKKYSNTFATTSMIRDTTPIAEDPKKLPKFWTFISLFWESCKSIGQWLTANYEKLSVFMFMLLWMCKTFSVIINVNNEDDHSTLIFDNIWYIMSNSTVNHHWRWRKCYFTRLLVTAVMWLKLNKVFDLIISFKLLLLNKINFIRFKVSKMGNAFLHLHSL